jgi:pilus assembly protein CpaB
MNTARIVVLGIALVAGGVAAYLASGSEPAPPAPPPAVVQTNTVDVLVAHSDISLGQTISADNLEWQSWPSTSASSTFIRRTDRPDATSELVGDIARSPFVAGEPIRETKLVKGNGSGFMAAILPSGMRAVSTQISPETGAGGFILPNDRVDVILSRKPNGQGDTVVSETILNNIRVLAIDQQVEEQNGMKVVVGKTATLELNSEQSEILARSQVRAQQGGTLSLALRSMVDANVTDEKKDDGRGGINIVRRGVTSTFK